MSSLTGLRGDWLGGFGGAAARQDELDRQRHDRDEDDRHDDDRKVLLHELHGTEEEAGIKEHGYPGDTAGDVVDEEPGVAHVANAGHEGRERADDRDEPGNDDRL